FVSRMPEAFYELLLREKVTVLNQTPSAFRQLMQAEEKYASPQALSLRLVIFGGEALALPSLREWVERHGDEYPQLVNMYGITETTVHVTYRRLRVADIEEAKGSLIGGPIPDLQAYILDGHGQPLPVGVPGELYVGGAGLARGYLGRPELTARRFVPNPFGVEGGARLYRTGDRARYLPDGDLEYLGRLDYQVKIRGFRIELGEIEAALGKHPAIQEAVVSAREDATGSKRLVGYVVARPPSPSPTVNELRAFLKESLPDYMIPSEFVMLDALPLTTNGKVNRQALPAPDLTRSMRAESYIAPRTANEEILATIWADVLRREYIGVRDNFFELGGDSILAIQIVARAKEAGLQFSIRQLFQLQTIEELDKAIEPLPEGEPDSQSVAAQLDSTSEKSTAPDGNDFGWSRDEYEDITSLLREHEDKA
nr:non-ribosomal peptide synthetase [Acidobacteriota bacterium]